MKTGKFFCIALLLISFFLVFSFRSQIQAGGGGRAVITVLQNGVAGQKQAEIVATITKDNDNKISPGEKGIFRIKNQSDGQNCLTKNEAADGSGKIYGSCSSPSEGQMEVYIFFPDKVEDGTPYKVPFAAKGQAAAPVELNYMQKDASAPCGSGLVSYGWDESDGAACGQFQYDAWTAFCGNGYKHHTKLNQCMNANDLSLHTDWKEIGEAICRDPRCNTPAAKSAAPTTAPAASSAPLIKRGVTKIDEGISSGQPSTAIANVTAQYLLTEQQPDASHVNLELYFKAQAGANDGRAYFIPIMGNPNQKVTVFPLPVTGEQGQQTDPWLQLNTQFGLSFTSTDKGYVDLVGSPQVFTQDNKDDLYALLKQQKIPVASSLRAAIESVFNNPSTSIVVAIAKDKPEQGKWLPPLKISGVIAGIQDFFYPVVWNDGHISQNTNLNMQIGVVSIDPYQPVNKNFENHQYDFGQEKLEFADQHITAKYLSEVKLFNIRLDGDWTVLLHRDNPDFAKVEILPKHPAPLTIDQQVQKAGWQFQPITRIKDFFAKVWSRLGRVMGKSE